MLESYLRNDSCWLPGENPRAYRQVEGGTVTDAGTDDDADIEGLLSDIGVGGSEFERQLVQTRFRRKLADIWGIRPGTTILEVGCGQGDMTLVLAAATNEDGHVTAIDAAAESSGTPLTFAQATERIRRSRFGTAIHFQFGVDVLDPMLALPRDHYDCAVFAHSLWYFASADLVRRTLERARELASRLYISEWDLAPATESQLPHFAAALIQGWTSAVRPDRHSNIQTLMTRPAIARLVQSAGWTIESNVSVDTSHLQDGRWEVQNALQILSSGAETSRALEGLDLESVRQLLQQVPIETLPSFALSCFPSKT